MENGVLMRKNKKICLIASSGGHYNQIKMLDKLSNDYTVYYVTEKTKYIQNEKDVYYVKQVNRQEKKFLYNLTVVFFQSMKIFIKENPDIIISTGALSVIPSFLIGKMMKKKLIFIESFAKIDSPTLTGKFLYKISDVFIIQWESMKEFYPNAIFIGGIY